MLLLRTIIVKKVIQLKKYKIYYKNHLELFTVHKLIIVYLLIYQIIE